MVRRDGVQESVGAYLRFAQAILGVRESMQTTGKGSRTWSEEMGHRVAVSAYLLTVHFPVGASGREWLEVSVNGWGMEWEMGGHSQKGRGRK